MLATKLIEELQKIIAENGDVEMYIYDREAWPDYRFKIGSIQKDKDSNSEYWVIE